jgi:hypothetical protein
MVSLLAQAALSLYCFSNEAKVECNGKYKGGLKPTDAELKEILKQHAAWLKDGGQLPLALDNPKVAGERQPELLCLCVYFQCARRCFAPATRRAILRDDPTMVLPGTLNRLPELQTMIGIGLITRETAAVLRYHATTSGIA